MSSCCCWKFQNWLPCDCTTVRKFESLLHINELLAQQLTNLREEVEKLKKQVSDIRIYCKHDNCSNVVMESFCLLHRPKRVQFQTPESVEELCENVEELYTDSHPEDDTLVVPITYRT